MFDRPKHAKAGANMPASAKRPPKSASQPVSGSKPCGRAKKASTPGNHSGLPTLIEIGDVASSKSGSTVPEAPPSIPESIVPTFASQMPEDLEDDIPFIQANSVCEHSPSSFSRERQLRAEIEVLKRKLALQQIPGVPSPSPGPSPSEFQNVDHQKWAPNRTLSSLFFINDTSVMSKSASNGSTIVSGCGTGPDGTSLLPLPLPRICPFLF